jgi:hypothetical protein
MKLAAGLGIAARKKRDLMAERDQLKALKRRSVSDDRPRPG